MHLKPLVKHSVQTALAMAGPHRWPRQGGKLVALMYHRVLPREDPRFALEQPGMLVTPETFRAHLQWLKRYFRPVTLPAWIKGDLPAGADNRPCCAVTFDDGWRDNHEYALPILREAGVPATLFVVSDFMDTAHDFWPGRTQKLLERLAQPVPPDVNGHPAFAWLSEVAGSDVTAGETWSQEASDAVIGKLKAYTDDAVEQHLDAMEQALGMVGEPPERVLLSWEEIREMVSDGTFVLGSHTRRHRRLLPELSAEALESEIAGSQQVIAERTGQPAEVFCYPNGDRSPQAELLVRAHYLGACLTRRGWNARDTDPYELRRVSIHEDMTGTRSAFLARVAAVL